jgi:hypothetical protein
MQNPDNIGVSRAQQFRFGNVERLEGRAAAGRPAGLIGKERTLSIG